MRSATVDWKPWTATTSRSDGRGERHDGASHLLNHQIRRVLQQVNGSLQSHAEIMHFSAFHPWRPGWSKSTAPAAFSETPQVGSTTQTKRIRNALAD